MSQMQFIGSGIHFLCPLSPGHKKYVADTINFVYDVLGGRPRRPRRCGGWRRGGGGRERSRRSKGEEEEEERGVGMRRAERGNEEAERETERERGGRSQLREWPKNQK